MAVKGQQAVAWVHKCQASGPAVLQYAAAVSDFVWYCQLPILVMLSRFGRHVGSCGLRHVSEGCDYISIVQDAKEGSKNKQPGE